MAGTLIQSTAVTVTSGTSGAITITGVTSGSTLVLHTGWDVTSSAAITGVSDGNAYTDGDTTRTDAGNTEASAVYFLQNAGSGSHTITVSLSASAPVIYLRVHEIGGVVTSGGVNRSTGQVQTSPGTATDGISSSATAATTAANCFVLGVSQNNSEGPPGTGSFSAGTGYTLSGTEAHMAAEWKNVTSTGAQTATFTQSVNNSRTTQVLAFEVTALAPIITVQPTNQSTNSGSTATFTALASGSGGTITYQWQDTRTGSFTNVASGGTSASYTTPATDATYQGRSYRVVATDSNGSVTSGTAQLNVLGLPVYLWDTSVQAGNDVWLRNPLVAGAAGALSGASALTFSQSAVLEGSGALFGTSPLAFTQAGAISGIAALTATSTLTFTQSGAIAGILAASGTAALTFTQSGVIAGAGALSGTSPLAFTQSGTLIGNAPITGTSALTFSQSGSISGVGSLSGTSALVFTQSGTLSSLASGSISGTSSLTFSASASIAGSGALVGSSGLTFSQSASLTGTAPVTGSAALAFSPVAVIVGSGALTGTAGLAFSVSGTLGQADASALVGSASLLFTASGNLLGSGGEQFTGGFFYAFERERAKREKARRKRLEDEEEASRLKSEVDREIARLLLAQEAKAAQREEMARLTTLVEQAAKIRTRNAFNARVNAALERATQKATISALLTFEREVQRQMDAEDSAVLLMLLND